MKNLAVIFPGIGYHVDKPLLYYTRKLLKEFGYEVLELQFKDFPQDVFGSKEKLEQSLEISFLQATELLKDVNFSDYENIIFVSKSIGTSCALRYDIKNNVNAYHVLFTPLALTFSFLCKDDVLALKNKVLAFHGTSDPWFKNKECRALCKKNAVTLVEYKNANHSLETGNAMGNVKILQNALRKVKKFIRNTVRIQKKCWRLFCRQQ